MTVLCLQPDHGLLGMSTHSLKQQNLNFRGTGGISQENRNVGFIPAFKDADTDRVYLSRDADGRLASCHLLDNLPDDLVLERDSQGKIKRVKQSLISGFCLHGQFYTREQASQKVKS